MRIEYAVCPCCNCDLRVNVPADREIEDVYVFTTIFTALMNKPGQQLLCPKCGITAHIRYSKPKTAGHFK